MQKNKHPQLLCLPTRSSMKRGDQSRKILVRKLDEMNSASWKACLLHKMLPSSLKLSMEELVEK